MPAPALLLALALAQEKTGEDRILSEAPPFDAYTFTLATCDGVRARFDEPRPPDRVRAEEVFVTLHNASPSLCLYRGVSLQGALRGAYNTNRQRQGDGAGFFLPAGESVRIVIKPDDPALPRQRIFLEIAPGRGTILLAADGGAPPAAATP